jgi:hypothetical protein
MGDNVNHDEHARNVYNDEYRLIWLGWLLWYCDTDELWGWFDG